MKKSIKNKIQGLRTIAGVLLCFLMVISLVPTSLTAKAAANKKESASQIKLEKKEGTVTVTSSAGKSQSVRSGMRLYSGSHVKTGQKSSVWLSLDNSKAAKIDSNSDIEFRKRGNKLELMIHSGRIFFSVAEKLKNNETMNIKTSNATTGVRGTDGWADTDSTGLLTGKIKLTITDPVTGKVVVKWVEAGQSLSGLEGARKTPEKVDLSYLKATLIRGDQAPAIVPEVLIEQPQICERAKQNLDRFGFDIDEMIASAAEKRAKEDAEAAKKAEQIADEIAQNQPEAQEEKIPTFKEETVEDPGPADTTVVEPSGGGGYVPDPTPTPTQCAISIQKGMVYRTASSYFHEVPLEDSGNYKTTTMSVGETAGFIFYFDQSVSSITGSVPVVTVNNTPVTVEPFTDTGISGAYQATFTVPATASATVSVSGYSVTESIYNITFSSGHYTVTQLVYTTGTSSGIDAVDNDYRDRFRFTAKSGEMSFSIQPDTGYVAAPASYAVGNGGTATLVDGQGSFTLSGDTTITVSGIYADSQTSQGALLGVRTLASGSGANARYALDLYSGSTNNVTASTSGEQIDIFDDGTLSLPVTWNKDAISSVTIKEGITVAEAATTSWFKDFTGVTSITGLSNITLTSEASFEGLFMNCSSLQTLDLSGITTDGVISMKNMFSGCSSLSKIYVTAPDATGAGGFTVSSDTNTEGMFSGCSSLVGEHGTTYNPVVIDGTYARIDNLDEGYPGYFWAK